MVEIEILHPGGAILGEGPVYDARASALWWVDIKARLLHCTPLNGAPDRTWQLPGQPGCLALDPAHDAIILALEDGIFRFTPDDGTLDRVSPLTPGAGTLRFNDGKTDPTGRLWVGDLDDIDFPPTGTLYMIDRGGCAQARSGGIRCSNGLGWTADGHRMFHTDSLARTIWAWEFDPDTGQISNRTVFAQVAGPAVPDGLAVDERGCVWSAHWDGAAVVQYGPDGTEKQRIVLPATRPTSCAFGGPGLETLFVTSASIGLDDSTRRPHDGAVFALRGLARGVPVADFGMPLPL